RPKADCPQLGAKNARSLPRVRSSSCGSLVSAMRVHDLLRALPAPCRLALAVGWALVIARDDRARVIGRGGVPQPMARSHFSVTKLILNESQLLLEVRSLDGSSTIS